jgi:hypothetical protein
VQRGYVSCSKSTPEAKLQLCVGITFVRHTVAKGTLPSALGLKASRTRRHIRLHLICWKLMIVSFADFHR